MEIAKKGLYLFAVAAISCATLDVTAATTSGTATARVVKPSFTASCDALSFGNIIKAKSPGLITITPKGKRITRGRVKVGSAAYRASTCKVKGPANTSYTARAPFALTFTAQGVEKKKRQRDRLLVSNIRIKSRNLRKKGYRVYRGLSDESGRDELYVGATLFVPKNAAAGVYQGIIPITIHY